MHRRPDVSRFLIWVPATRADAVVKLRKLARMRRIDERHRRPAAGGRAPRDGRGHR